MTMKTHQHKQTDRPLLKSFSVPCTDTLWASVQPSPWGCFANVCDHHYSQGIALEI